jgi:hypothetical protein
MMSLRGPSAVLSPRRQPWSADETDYGRRSCKPALRPSIETWRRHIVTDEIHPRDSDITLQRGSRSNFDRENAMTGFSHPILPTRSGTWSISQGAPGLSTWRFARSRKAGEHTQIPDCYQDKSNLVAAVLVDR